MLDSVSGPLTGVRVLDLTAVLLGPYTTQILGDLGATIIKVESPAGETTRNVGPKHNRHMAAVFLNMNRNKRSIVIDLATPQGREALLKLAASCDVFVHNMRPKAIKKLGLTYPELCAVNENIVYGAAFGYGQAGPYADHPAYDDLIQGISGLADLQARASQSDPKYMPTVLADKTAGLTLAYAILAALYAREKTGKGQEVSVPMFETMVSYVLVEHLVGTGYEPPLGPMGYSRVLSQYRKPFKTKDGFVCILPYTDRHWLKYFDLIGRTELTQDPKYSEIAARTENIDGLYQLLEEQTVLQTTQYWLDLLGEAEIPCAPVNTLDDLLEDEHLNAVNFFRVEEHPSEGRVRYSPNPVEFSETPVSLHRSAPQLGEHSREILLEAGVSEAQCEQLVADGIVTQYDANNA